LHGQGYPYCGDTKTIEHAFWGYLATVQVWG
jgi:hypothetical protein